MDKFKMKTQVKELQQSIPKILHFIWLGDRKIPKNFINYMTGWKDLHQNWEYKLWTNTPFLKNIGLYNKSELLAQKADIVRYEILYKFGGVYVDTDMECIKCIEPLTKDLRAFVGYENDEGLVGNAIIGAIPKHPLLDFIINVLPYEYVNNTEVIWQTGPGLLTKCVKYLNQDVKIFERKIFYPITSFGERELPKFDYYTIHHWSYSGWS
jgi:mannosyltransferase OCH1-like enzyme